jgi:Glycosyltransferase
VGFGGDPEYERELRRLETAHEWVKIRKNVDADTLSRLLGESNVYVHGKHAEHYGMSVAEALISGCVCLVHDSGGQVEIVGGDPAYTYTDDADLRRSSLVFWTVIRMRLMCSSLRHCEVRLRCRDMSLQIVSMSISYLDLRKYGFDTWGRL